MKEIQASNIPYYIVDVFAEHKYEGNQLAVVICNENFPESLMQVIAKEMNYSETIFITSIENYEVRIFTPEKELPFAGHPTLGGAYILAKEFIREKIKTISLDMKIGEIAVLFKYKGEEISEVWMDQKQPEFSNYFSTELLANILRLKEADFDGRFQIQEVSTGLPTIIVPLKTLDAVKRARIDEDRYYELVNKIQAKSILIFCPEPIDKKNDLHVRFFANYYGVLEDPATGSGNGSLAAYLVKHEYFGKKIVDIRVEQGYEIGRPSLLLLRSEEKGGKFFISVGGKVILVAKGELL
jgi:trans-2,3-dihydro-3-hydroxyanthranilate isomerase